MPASKVISDFVKNNYPRTTVNFNRKQYKYQKAKSYFLKNLSNNLKIIRYNITAIKEIKKVNIIVIFFDKARLESKLSAVTIEIIKIIIGRIKARQAFITTDCPLKLPSFS